MTVFFILLRSPPFSKEKMPFPAYLFLAKQYRAKDGELAACGFFGSYAAMEGPAARLVAQAMEPKGGTPERR